MCRYLQARTDFFDRVTLNALDRQVAQIVVVGAGYDGRALRYRTSRARWWEIDRPTTHRDKRARLARLGLATDHVTFLAVDLADGGLAKALTESGFRPNEPALFLAEGVVSYLDADTFRTMLRELRSVAARGTRLALSLPRSGVDPGERARFDAHVAALGEPAVGSIGTDDAEGFLAECGWGLVELSERARTAGFLMAAPTFAPVELKGDLLTEAFDYDGGRQVTAYVPPDPAEAVVFAGDGQLISNWGSVLEQAGMPSTMIIGAHRSTDGTLRLHEYALGFDPGRFAAHEKFFVDDVRRWARARLTVALPRERTAVCGVSASGELALAMGLRHPDIYGVVFCASPGGGFRPPGVMPSPLPHTYLVAGTSEPFLRENATRWAEALGGAGGDVVLTERDGSHGGTFWRDELPLMVAWPSGVDVSGAGRQRTHEDPGAL